MEFRKLHIITRSANDGRIEHNLHLGRPLNLGENALTWYGKIILKKCSTTSVFYIVIWWLGLRLQHARYKLSISAFKRKKSVYALRYKITYDEMDWLQTTTATLLMIGTLEKGMS